MRSTIGILTLVAVAALSRPARAQVIGIQAVHVAGRDGRPASSGVQGELGMIKRIPYLDLWPSLALEYQWSDTLSPVRDRVAAELRVLPGHDGGHLLPYLGVSVSGNRSGTRNSEWPGWRAGLQGMAGFLLLGGEHLPVALVVEERLGYVRGQNHETATHAGLLFSFD
jgi:hypothetical protein